MAAGLPARAARAAKPVRRGIAYLLAAPDGRVLLERRPERGLLGGMLGLPGTLWAEGEPVAAPPAPADWCEAGEVRHSFTHFHLRLRVLAARSGAGGAGFETVRPQDLPSVMQKALALGLAALGPA
jgi:A/G-specific adenine glycosylase